ncbi:N-acetyltransferase [Pedobacter sp. G11]|uniref:GNAT family N-acetyltransferase n=1 Tax=Pedobacter sp. G11 TaxID=2482728 RepID=UPI000F5F6DBF|nr:GNAT family N-acetyltransferase [Pedobacter sp. G11]AZI26435.1 N-acetyltransferase [Pedobacter sp. G11]
MLLPIAIKHSSLTVNSFSAEDISRYQSLVEEVLEIRSNSKTLKFLPNKRIKNSSEAGHLLQNMLLNAYVGRGQTCFIRQNKNNELVGIIEIIPPHVAREHYELEHYPYFIEFYLKHQLTGRAVMSKILPLIIRTLNDQGITVVAAVVNRANLPALRVLRKNRFTFQKMFDPFQDLYINQL